MRHREDTVMTLEEFNSLEVGDVIIYLGETNYPKRVVLEKNENYFWAENPITGGRVKDSIDYIKDFVLEYYKLGYTKVSNTRLARKMYPNAKLKDGLLIIKEI